MSEIILAKESEVDVIHEIGGNHERYGLRVEEHTVNPKLGFLGILHPPINHFVVDYLLSRSREQRAEGEGRQETGNKVDVGEAVLHVNV